MMMSRLDRFPSCTLLLELGLVLAVGGLTCEEEGEYQEGIHPEIARQVE